MNEKGDFLEVLNQYDAELAGLLTVLEKRLESESEGNLKIFIEQTLESLNESQKRLRQVRFVLI